MKKTNIQIQSSSNESSVIDNLFHQASEHIEDARNRVQRSINSEMVKAYWNIGKNIVNAEQLGESKAQYGKFILKELSERLTNKYGRGFSISTLKDIRQFYLTYSNAEISHAVRGQFESKIEPNLGWIHYRSLMRVDRLEVRQFYTIEAIKNSWSGRELERQINSLLFDRLARSKDKEGLLSLVNEGQEINKPEDAIKEPLPTEEQRCLSTKMSP